MDATKEACGECRSMEQIFEEYKAFCKLHPNTELNKKLNKIFWITLIVGALLFLAMYICDYLGAYKWMLGISVPKRPPVPYIHKVGNQLGKLPISTLSELW